MFPNVDADCVVVLGYNCNIKKARCEIRSEFKKRVSYQSYRVPRSADEQCQRLLRATSLWALDFPSFKSFSNERIFTEILSISDFLLANLFGKAEKR